MLGTIFFLSGCQTTSKEEVKYVFVFLGDGMGINQVASTRYWEAQEEGQSGEESIWKKDSFDSFPVTGFMSTHNIELGVTDSAASATAIFSGKKTKNGFLNYNPETEEAYTPFAKKLKESGYAVGVIFTTSLEHASPAALYANAEDRYQYEEIARQGIACGWLDFWAAGGFHGEEEMLFREAEDNGFTVARTPEELKKAYTEGAEAFTGELCKMKADKAKIQLVSGSHSGQPVPVYAIGKGAEIFSGVYDNTEIYEKLNTII